MMIPITRKEKYINEIVGGGNTAPETPQTREELFFAEILGEVVAPSPVTRVEKYLLAIAGQYSGELPEPVTRIERFIARAAGMDVTIPTPITREEMLWNTYIPIKIIEGIPPLTFRAKKAGTLNNYRIYGNTETLTRSYSGSAPLSFPIVDGGVSNYRIYGNTVNGENVGDLITEGEHAGEYSVPVTVSNGTDTLTTPIYLPEPIKMVGDEAEYIDYAEQKQHRVRKNLCQINKTNNAVISHAIEGQIYTFSLTADFSVGFRILKRNADSGSTEEVAAVFNREGRASATFTANENFDVYVNGFSAVGGKTFLDSVHDFMFEKGATASEYEPYIENTELDVTLPALPTVTGTNVLSVGTTVQPSSVAVDVAEVVSCGDRTKNLLQNTATSRTINGITFTVNSDGSVTCNGTATNTTSVILKNGYNSSAYTDYDRPIFKQGMVVIASTGMDIPLRARYTNGNFKGVIISNTPWYIEADVGIIYIQFDSGTSVNSTIYPMIRKADITDATYEPYGYKIPVTLTAGSAETTDIYLDEPLAKSGNNADYIDYATQKRHNSDGTNEDVTLPEITVTAGMNTLTVGTEVQPSSVEIKGRIQEVTP